MARASRTNSPPNSSVATFSAGVSSDSHIQIQNPMTSMTGTSQEPVGKEINALLQGNDVVGHINSQFVVGHHNGLVKACTTEKAEDVGRAFVVHRRVRLIEHE